MKITDQQISERISKPYRTLQELKKREPKTVELIRKGMLYEMIVNREIEREYFRRSER